MQPSSKILLKFILIILLCYPISCCFIIRPPKLILEPKVAVAVLWDVDTIYLTSKNTLSLISQGKATNIDANQNLSIIYLKDSVKVYKSPKKIILSSPDKIIFESTENLLVGKTQKAMTAYHKRIIITKGVTHRFPVKNNLTAINVLPIEEYLYGVVSCEIGMAKEIELEAVKAQAICARSYTMSLLNKRKDFDVYGSYLYDQEYKGADREYKLAIRAVQETRGEIMQYRDETILAQYSACCGGHTTYGRYEYLQPIIDAPKHSKKAKPYCKDSPYFEWTVKIPRNLFDDSVLKLAGITYKFKLNPVLEINKTTQRVDYLKFQTQQENKISGETIRKAFNLKSTYFSTKTKNDTVEINGHGWGHGIGLCQYGALEMARQKNNYKKILNHYYSGIKITKLY